jgi:DNA mismatch repair protein MutS
MNNNIYDNNNIDMDNDKIYKMYINKHNELSKKYGQKTLILMMVGSFYEMYAVFDNGPNLHEISKLLNIICTRKNKSQPESWANPKMMGFQMNSLEKFLEMLTNNNYTVIVFDQKVKIDINADKKKDKKKITREISGIYTKSTNINNLQQYNNNYLLCMYITNEEQKNSKPLKSIGLSCVDLSTGQVLVHSSYSEKYDEYIALDDASRFINNMNPGEILIYYDNSCKNFVENDVEGFLYGYFNIEQDKCRFYNKIDLKYKDITFQNEYLKKIYPNSETLLTPIEQLDLEKDPNVIISLCLLFDFVYDKMPSFLKNIKHPEFNFDTTHLILGNNAIYQLDVFDNKDNINLKTKYKSLFHVVNETLTPLGERYLRNMLSSPLINKQKISSIYDTTDKMRALNMPNELNVYLQEIRDIERLARKFELQIIKPFEIMMFIASYENIIQIYNAIESHKEFKTLITDKTFNKNIEKFIQSVNKIFDVEKLALYNDFDFNEKINIYNKDIHKDIDELNNKIHSGKTTVEKLANTLAGYFPKSKKDEKIENASKDLEEEKILIRNSKKEGNHIFMGKTTWNVMSNIFTNKEYLEYDNKKIKITDLKITSNKSGCKIEIPTIKKSSDLFKIKNNLLSLLTDNHEIQEEKSCSLQIKNNSQDGYYISMTANRANILKENLKKTQEIDLGFKKIKVSELEFKISKNTAKIMIPDLNEHADKLEDYVSEISDLYKCHYIDDVTSIFSEFKQLFIVANEFITNIDYLNSCTILSLKKGYTKPTIQEQKYSYVEAKKIRHPIVERIIDYEYVPHDISIGNQDLKGMLIYGLNSSGKSVLMKSIGLCIIMAQCGLYVPADSFTFSPYYKLMTRITGNDNIFKGLSSFGIEMSEINSILKRSNENTLIIGDEICRGTEHISGNALVAATIIKLAKLKPTFIFTTHLHEIMSLTEIKSIESVKAYHLKVSYDTKTQTLIYDRILTEGCGEPIYGITVAKYIIQDNEFIDNAVNIKNELLNNYNSLISGKTSKYNSDIYVYECNVCHTKDNVKLTNLETHHINFQRNCDENNVVKDKKHIKKNDKSNLVVLCQTCHDKIHSEELKINGYVKTSKGKQLVK